MELKESMLTRDEIFSGRVFRVTRDKILLPDGSKGIRELVHSYGGVVILPMDEQGRVTLVHQFRYAQDRILLEAVAGKLEPGEEPFAAAKRELQEELYLYRAEGLHPGEQHLDRGEFLRCETMPLDELGRRIAEGEVEDGKTLAIYLKAVLRERKGERNG